MAVTLITFEMARRAACERPEPDEHKPFVLTDEQVAAVDEQSDQVERDDQ